MTDGIYDAGTRTWDERGCAVLAEQAGRAPGAWCSGAISNGRRRKREAHLGTLLTTLRLLTHTPGGDTVLADRSSSIAASPAAH